MARYHRSSLTALQSRRLRTLPALPEDESISPTDSAHISQYSIDMDSNSTSSKRKRDSIDGSPSASTDVELFTPKRSRPSVRSPDINSTPAQLQSIRRKRGIRNLSDLSLEHATDQSLLSPRGSKFQEGSLTDKPSEAPPSVYTRVTRTDSSNLMQMDELMADYHEGQAVTDTSAHHPEMDYAGSSEQTETAGDGHSTSFLRLGRSLATSFHPVNLWNRIWNEQKEELTRQHMLDAERKAKLKSEAEIRYAEMKKTGQFNFHPLSGAAAPDDPVSTPYDSAVSLENDVRTQSHNRMSSLDSHPLLGRPKVDDQEESEPPSTASKALRSIRSRLYLKRPSLSNLKNDLKRVRSDVNLGITVHRESSSSASPVKTDFESSLKRSHSKFDLRKQHKLSKRVSDLELKLKLARKDLEDALAEASPAPKFGNKYERFTSTPTLKRPKFVPGRLPTLPSEGVLFPGLAENAARDKSAQSDGNDVNMSEEQEDEETVRAPRERQYPTRASTLFQLDDADPARSNSNDTSLEQHTEVNNSTQQNESPQGEVAIMDPNSIDTAASETIEVQVKKSEYSALDLKLKALDRSYKTARKVSTSKKRKSGDRDDGVFKLGKEGDEDDDDAEWDEANQTPKKRRKSGPVKFKPAQEKAGNGASAAQKLRKTRNSKKTDETNLEKEPESGAIMINDSDEDVLDNSSQLRSSVEVQAHQLEPVYEEEEDVITVPLKDVPSKPTAKATPARYARTRSLATRSQSQAGEAVVEGDTVNRARTRKSGRTGTPPPDNYSTELEVIDEVVKAVPGKDGVPNLPDTGKIAAGKSKGKDENFEWPDDVF